MNYYGLLILAAGVFAVYGAVREWDVFFNSRKTRGVLAVLVRHGTRVCYFLLGLGISVLGLLVILGIVEATPWTRRDSQSNPMAQTVATSGQPLGVETSSSADPKALLNDDERLAETTVAGIELVPRDVLDGKVKLLVPKSFSVMSDELREAKYPEARRPSLVFTNDETTVNIAFSHTQNRMTSREVPGFVRYFEKSAKQLVPVTDWIGSRSLDAGGVNWFLMENRTQGIDMTIRNWMAATSLDDRLLLVSFNAPQAQEEAWTPIVDKIMNSLRISPSTGPRQRLTSGLNDLLASVNQPPPDATPLPPLPAEALGQGEVTIKVVNLASHRDGPALAERIRAATQSTSFHAATHGHELTLKINGVGDLQVLAEALNIGKVSEVNADTRTISIRANPGQEMAVTSPNQTTTSSFESSSTKTEQFTTMPAGPRPFEITLSPKLKPVPLFSANRNAIVSTKDGRIDKSGNQVMFTVAFDPQQVIAPADREEFVNRRATSDTTNGVKTTAKSVQPVRFDGLEGFELVAESVHPTNGTLIVLSVVLFDDMGTFFMMGVASLDQQDEFIPEFRVMIQSFKKAPRKP